MNRGVTVRGNKKADDLFTFVVDICFLGFYIVNHALFIFADIIAKEGSDTDGQYRRSTMM